MTEYNAERFIDKSKIVHNNTYDYSKVKYHNTNTKVEIVCNIHGSFFQKPSKHLFGQGCMKCGHLKRKISDDVFLSKALEKHGSKYDYSRISKNGGSNKKEEFVCEEHGIFVQRRRCHLSGKGCPKCVYNTYKLSTEEFIEKVSVVHCLEYDYSKAIYVSNYDNLEIICKIHGSFFQTPSNHLAGRGCPKCGKVESSGEKRIRRWLTKNDIEYEQEKSFKGCNVTRKPLQFDFYLPQQQLLIEFDGIQHYKAFDRFKGEEGLSQRQSRDEFKNSWAKEHGYDLLRISYKDFENICCILSERLQSDLVSV